MSSTSTATHKLSDSYGTVSSCCQYVVRAMIAITRHLSEHPVKGLYATILATVDKNPDWKEMQYTCAANVLSRRIGVRTY